MQPWRPEKLLFIELRDYAEDRHFQKLLHSFNRADRRIERFTRECQHDPKKQTHERSYRHIHFGIWCIDRLCGSDRRVMIVTSSICSALLIWSS